MPQYRRSYSAKRSRRTSRQVRESTVGTHVARSPRPSQGRRNSAYAEAVARRARLHRALVAVVALVVVVALAVGAGILAFRGAVGGALSLRNSDAADALVAVRSGEPSYTLVTAELGAVADPLDNGGPDVVLLARLDPEAGTLALVNIPSGLQITIENRSDSVAEIANSGDAALISAISTFAKVEISHFVKIASADDLVGFVDALGGVGVDVGQEIDDPHAGSMTIPAGARTLDGREALTFLRASNLEYGAQDRLDNQLDFAASAVTSLFSEGGTLASKLEAVGGFVQTDYSLADLESIDAWLGGALAADVATAVLPGYFTVVTNVTGTDDGRYVSTSSEVAGLVNALENGEELPSGSLDSVGLVSPSGFTVEIQNGTTIEGAAAAAADELKAAGFKVGDVGNAEQAVYGETLVVYRGSDAQGQARAKTVIDAYGVGRAVDGEAYYSFDADVLLVLGADNKPVS